MAYQIRKLEELEGLVKQHSPQEGVNLTSIDNVATFKASTTLERSPAVDEAAFVIVAQGRKHCYSKAIEDGNAGAGVTGRYIPGKGYPGHDMHGIGNGLYL